VGERERFRTKVTARAASCLVLAVAAGCGSSLKKDYDGDGGSGTETGGAAGERGGSGGTSGESGGSTQGGSPASGGSSARGGSAEGGSTQGGASGAAGEGGGDRTPTRLFLQSGSSLLAVDPETTETTELCRDTTTPARYDLIDWVNERAIVFRQHTMAPTAGEILRVALDGSECASLLLSDSVYFSLQPAAGNHVVVAINPVLTSAFDAPNGEARITRPMGLASFALDGVELEVLAPDGVLYGQVAGERVLFQRAVETFGYDAFSALPGAGSVTELVPVPGPKTIDVVRGHRVVVSDRLSGSVWAVDTDGGNLASLATGPEITYGVGFVEGRVILGRSLPTTSVDQSDLMIVDETGGVLVPIAASAESEVFRGSVGERIVYERASDLYTVRLDGSDARPVLETPGVGETFAPAPGDRMVIGSIRSSAITYFSAASDGSDVVTLHETATGFAAAVGDRVVLYVGDSYDLVSIPITGGDPWLLSDGPSYDWLVGTLGTMLVIQRGDRTSEGEVLRINVDGSSGTRLHSAARYLGSVSEACGAVVADRVNPLCSE
jgi:hypothetical protein